MARARARSSTAFAAHCATSRVRCVSTAGRSTGCPRISARISDWRAAASRGGHSSHDIEERCHSLLREVELDGKARRLPRDLTQVEMRKLELARAMAAEPKLLIADEAMAGLTGSEIADILALLVRLNDQGVTIILIEHIMSAVMSFSRRLVVLVSGRKIADGRPEEVMRDPEVERAYLGQ